MSKTKGRPTLSHDVESTFQRGLTLHQRGQLEQAESLYRTILRQVPNHFDALHLLGVIEYQRKHYETAVRLIGQAIKINPTSPSAHSNIGVAFRDLRRHEEALESFDRALAIQPRYPEALNNRGIALRDLGRHGEALDSYDRAVAINPDYADALCNRGDALCALKRHEEAVPSYDRALAIRPDHAEAWSGRGDALRELIRFADAVESYDRALAIKTDNAVALNNRGVALSTLKRHEEALVSFDRALAIKPDYVEAMNNRGVALRDLRRPEDAIASCDRALAFRPDYVEAMNNRGIALLALNRHEEALACYDRALAIRPDYTEAMNNRGVTLSDMGRHEEAAAEFRRLLRVNPEYEYASGNLFSSQLQCCDWQDYDRTKTLIADDVALKRRVAYPFVYFSVSDSPGGQLQCARIYNNHRWPASLKALSTGVTDHHDRIRVAYVSADFHAHATAFLMAELFEAHDKSRFETMAFSFGPEHNDPMRARLESAFSRFIDVRDKSDREAALLLRELEIDIAVDLKGYTKNSRPGIFAFRPAPIQVNYLGYPGTVGAAYIDYILADRFVIPEDQRGFYQEKVAYLPAAYQPNDSRRIISSYTPTRAEAGLPETGFVFCSFNNNYKITPPMFDVWMRILQNVEGSVLWLLEGNAAAVRNLRREASGRGIAPDRLIFAPRLKLEDHLARHRLAGIMLDTLPINAHTTASDALWTGLPLVTCGGRSFAGRVAGSLLHAVGLPELITSNLEQYEASAIDLARNETALAGIKAKLARNRHTCPLFDTKRLCRDIETTYETMWERYQRGEPPA